MGDGTSLRVTWTVPVAVSGASLLDFVVVRWRRKAGGHPIDMDDAQDGCVSLFLSLSLHPCINVLFAGPRPLPAVPRTSRSRHSML